MTARTSSEVPRRQPRRSTTLPSLVAASLRTPALTSLPPREQEIAAIVYLHTSVSAKDLEAALANEMSNSAIRCLLTRLMTKGVLRRQKGRGKTFLYSPAILLPDVQERALERLAEDYFGGSLCQASQHLLRLIGKREPEALPALSHQVAAVLADAAPAAMSAGARSFG